VRQHVNRSTPRPAPLAPFALRLLGITDARCVGPTSAISLLRTRTRASLVLDASAAFAAAHAEVIAWSTPVQFALAGRTWPPLRAIIAVGVVFPP